MPLDKHGHHYLERYFLGDFVNINNRRLGNVSPPEDDTDVVTLEYLRDALTNHSFETKYLKEGVFNLHSNRISNLKEPIASQDAVTKTYVDRHFVKLRNPPPLGDVMKNVYHMYNESDSATWGELFKLMSELFFVNFVKKVPSK